MRKLMTVVAILTLCASFALAQGANINPLTNNTADGDPATATLEVGLSVAKYAEVTWNNPTDAWKTTYGEAGATYPLPTEELAVQILGPNTGIVPKENKIEVPIRVRSNCDVLLSLGEGLTEALVAAGAPRAASFVTMLDPFVYWHQLSLYDPGHAAYSDQFTSRQIIQPSYHQNNPFGITGLWGYSELVYGAVPNLGSSSETIDSGFVYEGDLESTVAIGTLTMDNVVDDGNGGTWTWTDLPASTDLGNATYYAQVSVGN